MALGQKVLVALIIFLIGRKGHFDDREDAVPLDGGMPVWITRCDSFPAGADPVCDECIPAFMIAGQQHGQRLGGGSWRGRSCAEFGAPASLGNFAGGLLILIMKPFRVEVISFPRPGREGFRWSGWFTRLS